MARALERILAERKVVMRTTIIKSSVVYQVVAGRRIARQRRQFTCARLYRHAD
jgi:hypothetical protein